MNNNNYVGEGICGIVMAVATVLQTNEWLQNIQIVICIIAGILGIILTLWKLIKMYQIAKEECLDIIPRQSVALGIMHFM